MTELKDALGNRVVKTAPLPFQQSLTEQQLFINNSVNWELLREFLKREGKLNKTLLLALIKKARELFRNHYITK